MDNGFSNTLMKERWRVGMANREKQPKKLVLLNILDILRRYTDENHRLSQKEIENILKNEYEMNVDRKTVKTSLMNLEEFGYEIEYSELLRPIKNKKTGEVRWEDFEGNREIELSEQNGDNYVINIQFNNK